MNYAIFDPFTSSFSSSSLLRLLLILPQAFSASFEAEYEARPTKRARRSIRLRRRTYRSSSSTSSTSSTSSYLCAVDQRPLLIPPVPRGLHRHTFEDEAVYLTPVDDLHVCPYVEDVQIDEDHPIPTTTAVNSVTPPPSHQSPSSPEPIYIEDDIRGLASWNLDCVRIGRPELSEHAPSAAEHFPDAATADLVPATESDSRSTTVSQDRVVDDPSTWARRVGTSIDRRPGSIAALPSSNSTGVMAPQERAGDDEDSDKPAPDKGKARQFIPDLYETPPTPSLDSPALFQGANPFLLTVPLPWWALCNEEYSDNLPSTSGWAGVQDRTTTSMGPGTRATGAISYKGASGWQRGQRVVGARERAREDEEGEEARQGERAAFRWKSSGDDRPQPQEAVTARQLRGATGPSVSTSPGGQSVYPTSFANSPQPPSHVLSQYLNIILDLFLSFRLIISGPDSPAAPSHLDP
ncbi:hypothetical protein B0H13DRAFT_2316112 [Mycena leptocephala]|nr:hypothetical protein B0H13DRAFT_2316112 [Mycena leptocephala]